MWRIWETESCNGGVGISEGFHELCIGSDEFLHGVIFLDGSICQVVK